MTKKMKTNWKILALSFLAFCFLFASYAFCQEMPKPGEVIDKSNYKKYLHLFPEEFLAGFDNGWGLLNPISIKVSATKPSPIPKVYLKVSEKNRGKYTIDKNGFIAGGYDHLGLPFPDLKPGDKDFAIKLMWNFEYRYLLDDQVIPTWRQCEKRRAEAASWSEVSGYWMYFINRMFTPPKPRYDTPSKLLKANVAVAKEPPNMRNMAYLSYRYLDPEKADDLLVYLPTMRRVLRGEAGQRSTPLTGTTQAPDDYNGFDGRIQEFTYEFVKEQKVLGVAETTLSLKSLKEKGQEFQFPFPTENWEVRDVYVIDIKSKDPKYPQSKKRIYLDKENMTNIYYSVAWDRANKVWKVMVVDFRKMPLADETTVSSLSYVVGIDVQFGMALSAMGDQKINGNGLKYIDVQPSVLLKLGR